MTKGSSEQRGTTRTSGSARGANPQGSAARRSEGTRDDATRGRSGAGERPAEPDLPDDVRADMLDRDVRARLRTLGKENAERVARHLVVAGQLVDSDVEGAYAHAQAALRRAGRVDVVREAAGLTAYAAGHYAEALRELRTARRLSGQDVHRAVEADCERALGRPERALSLARAADAERLPAEAQVELAMVASGARLDMGEPDAALVALESPVVRGVHEPRLMARVAQARAAVLEALGRVEDAARERAAGVAAGPADEPGDGEVVVVYDLEAELKEPAETARRAERRDDAVRAREDRV